MSEQVGRDISAPMDKMELDGQERALRYDLNAFRIAEDVYELQYGREMNFGQIVGQLAAGKLGAIMAVMYGALVAGGTKMTWAEFSEKFRLTDIPGVKDKMLENLKKALPETEGSNPL